MFAWVIKIIQYERLDVSEGIDTNKTNASKECTLRHYRYFKDIGYKFEPHVRNDCHYISMMAYELKNNAILNVKDVHGRCVWWDVTKNDVINMLANSKLNDKGILWTWILVQKKHL